MSVLALGALAGVGPAVGRRIPRGPGPALAASDLLLLLRVAIGADQRFEGIGRRDGSDRSGPSGRSAAITILAAARESDDTT